MRLLGRADESAAVNRALGAAHAATSNVLLVRDEPGIGTTALPRPAGRPHRSRGPARLLGPSPAEIDA